MPSGNRLSGTKLVRSSGNSRKRAMHGSADSAGCTVPEAALADRRLQDDMPLVRVVHRLDDIVAHIVGRVAVAGLVPEQSKRSARRGQEQSGVAQDSIHKLPDSTGEDTEPTLPPPRVFAAAAETVPFVASAALVAASVA